jgi:hypothetical protein
MLPLKLTLDELIDKSYRFSAYTISQFRFPTHDLDHVNSYDYLFVFLQDKHSNKSLFSYFPCPPVFFFVYNNKKRNPTSLQRAKER